jgi:hypothetical protein
MREKHAAIAERKRPELKRILQPTDAGGGAAIECKFVLA